MRARGLVFGALDSLALVPMPGEVGSVLVDPVHNTIVRLP
jgi:hypothetical protein